MARRRARRPRGARGGARGGGRRARAGARARATAMSSSWPSTGMTPGTRSTGDDDVAGGGDHGGATRAAEQRVRPRRQSASGSWASAGPSRTSGRAGTGRWPGPGASSRRRVCRPGPSRRIRGRPSARKSADKSRLVAFGVDVRPGGSAPCGAGALPSFARRGPPGSLHPWSRPARRGACSKPRCRRPGAGPRAAPRAVDRDRRRSLVALAWASRRSLRDRAGPTPSIEVDGAGRATPASSAEAALGAAVPRPSAGLLVVEVGGAVAQPGVYRLPAGCAGRRRDRRRRAGTGRGSTRRSRTGSSNLAAPLHDGDEVRVPGPRRGAAPTPGGGGDRRRLDAAAPARSTSTTRRPRSSTRCPGSGRRRRPRSSPPARSSRSRRSTTSPTRKVVGAATLEKIRALVTVGP